MVTDHVLVANGVSGGHLSAGRIKLRGRDLRRRHAESDDRGRPGRRCGFRQSAADCRIAIGGGSPQDTCKAIGIITANPEFADVRSLEGAADTKSPSVPIIAVPTSAGTAAEVTINYVITDT